MPERKGSIRSKKGGQGNGAYTGSSIVKEYERNNGGKWGKHIVDKMESEG